MQGPDAGLEAVSVIRGLDKLDGYHLLHAVRGELEARRNRPEAAALHFQKAHDLAEIEAERNFLAKRLRDCAESGSASVP